METTIRIPDTQDRSEAYRALHPQVEALLHGEDDLIAAMANMSAAVHTAFGWHWVGFYRVKQDELILGPFQGPVACSRIGYGRGVCGTAWQQGRTIIVPDVERFPGHIACSALSRSEIVVPVLDHAQQVVAVLDIDSVEPDAFTEADAEGLKALCALLSPLV